jgi:hypothetical protein
MELRWYVFDDWDGLPADAEKPVVRTVLQWRRREGPRGEDWWGEWEDVPYARQPSLSGDDQ